MILLDSGHLTALQYRDHMRGRRLWGRIVKTDDLVATTIIAFEEQIRGWMSLIARETGASEQVGAYRELAMLGSFFAQWQIADFDETAAFTFDRLRQARVRIGSMDLKMAAIAPSQDALLLTGNSVDFAQVPGLRFANWLEG